MSDTNLHSIAHAKLLQHLAEKLGLKNDAAIARSLQTSPAIVSKVKGGTAVLSSNLLMRIVELLHLTSDDLCNLLGTEAYQHAVWLRESGRPSLNFKAMDADPEWAAQTDVVIALTTMIHNRGYAMLKAGQRSGKSTIAQRVAHRLDAKNIYIYAHTLSKSLSLAASFPEHVTTLVNAILPKSAELVLPNALVVFDEPFFASNSFAYFETARALDIPVLVVGSNGPDYNESWEGLSHVLSYNTWHLNPKVTRASLQPLYDRDAEKAKRDYEAF